MVIPSPRPHAAQIGSVNIAPKVVDHDTLHIPLQASIQGRHSVVPKTEIDVQLGDVEVEIDLTIIDRLHGVLYPSSNSADQPRPSSQYFTSAPLHTDAVSTAYRYIENMKDAD